MTGQPRTVSAVHAHRAVEPDPAFEHELSAHLRETHEPPVLSEMYGRFVAGEGAFDGLMRRVLVRTLARRVGAGLRVGPGVRFLHPETFEIGDNVFLGAGTYLQGRCDGRCVLESHAWIGPHSYFDARDLVLGEYVGWGPGARVLGSEHTGVPAHVPVIQTQLVIKPVRVAAWADVGTGAVLLPGVTVGKGAIVGAGAVVTKDVAPFTVVAGVPARVIGRRQPEEEGG